jgi:hypothetical protein
MANDYPIYKTEYIYPFAYKKENLSYWDNGRFYIYLSLNGQFIGLFQRYVNIKIGKKFIHFNESIIYLSNIKQSTKFPNLKNKLNTTMATTKANQLLTSAKSVEERANKFETSIKRNIQKKVLDPLLEQIEAKEDELYELENFSETKSLSQAECQEKFEKIIQIKFDITCLKAELQKKQETFDEYFTVQ